MAEYSGFVEPTPQLKAHELVLEEVAALIEDAAGWTGEQQAYLLAVLARYAAERAGELLAGRAVGGDPLKALLWLNARELTAAVQQSASVLAELIENLRNLEQADS